MSLTPEERTVLTARLGEAEQAYHALMTGVSARVVVDQNSERVEFTAANATRLYNYIAQLKAQLAPCDGTQYRNFGPAGFIF